MLETRHPGDLHYIGCCGWREARARYFSHFSVVELQDTFYEPPSTTLAEKWRSLAPANFQFTLKAWQLITHIPASPTYRRLKSKISPNEHDAFGAFRPTEQVWLAWERTRSIARTLRASVVLFQCPASFQPTAENVQNLGAFFRRMEPEEWLLAWEPRGAWPPDLVRSLCTECNLVHCVDPLEAESLSGPAVYWRMHGPTGYGHRYTDEELLRLRELADRFAAEGRGPFYILFNNVWMKQDALRFQQLVQPRE